MHHRQTAVRQLAGTARRRGRIDVIEPHDVDPADRLEGQALECGLRAIADHRHAPRALGGKVPGRHGAGGRRPHRGQDRHLAQQFGIARHHIGQNAEGGNGLQPLGGVLGVAVDVFEPIGFTVRGRHQLDDAYRGMRGDARGLVERWPAQEVGLDLG